MIEQTEALVSVDVNSGQHNLGQGTSREEAILSVNLDAAIQVLINQVIPLYLHVVYSVKGI